MSTRFSAPDPTLARPMLKARFARAYLDPNREPFELDPTMFEDALPDFVNRHSPRVRVGLGTIARVVASGEEIYARKLRFAEALQRIEQLYRPYHNALTQLVEATRSRFGFYLLLDCHSMPSTTLPQRGGLGRGRVDIVLGDCHGTSCDPIVADTAQHILVDKGYAVVRNAPYAGGFTTTHYGKPGDGGHCLQIEIGRGLYMDERSYERKPFFAQLAKDMRDLTLALARIDPALLRPACSSAGSIAGALRHSRLPARRYPRHHDALRALRRDLARDLRRNPALRRGNGATPRRGAGSRPAFHRRCRP